jgi:nitroreductase
MTNSTLDSTFDAVAETIKSRRTIKQFLDRPVPAELIDQLLDLAIWAPNHRMTEPWRFYVLEGDLCAAVGEIARSITFDKIAAAGGVEEVCTRKSAEAAGAWSSLPMLLFVTMVGDDNPELDTENYGAVCCAVQNFMLAAHAAGLATSWNSGAIAASPEMLKLVGAGPNERMVALLRVGYPDPDAPKPPARRTPASAFTRHVQLQTTARNKKREQKAGRLPTRRPAAVSPLSPYFPAITAPSHTADQSSECNHRGPYPPHKRGMSPQYPDRDSTRARAPSDKTAQSPVPPKQAPSRKAA